MSKETVTTPYAFDTRGHFMNCKWKPVKIIAETAWTMKLVEFLDGHRDYKLHLEYRP
jgi:hypothetical protein